MDIDKFKRALLESVSIGSEAKDVDNTVSKPFIDAITSIQWSPAPEGSKCLGCGGEALERSRTLMGGPWSGHVRCTACDYRDTLVSYLGKTMITVEPLSSDDDKH